MALHIPPSLYHRKFRLLWLGLMVSVAGSQMQVWALFWHIRQITEQPIALGGIGLARIIPVILFSLIGGAMADSLSRRMLLFVTQTAQALIALALALFTISGHITLWHIYFLTALQAMVMAFDLPARQAIVPNLLPARDLANAFSLNSIAFETGAIVGPAVNGLVIAYWGLQYSYLINAVSFGAVIVALIMMGKVEQTVIVEHQKGLSVAAIKDGIRFISGHPVILPTMITDFIATFFSSANTLLPILARDVLHVGAMEYGWLSAAQSMGAVLIGLTASQKDRIRRQGPLFIASVMVFGAATALFGVAHSFVWAMAALILVGAADAVSTIIRNTIRQLQTPDHIRGRMTSINQIFFMGGPQLGEVEAGVVAQLFGAPFAIISGGIGCMLAVFWVAKRWPGLLKYDGSEMEMTPAAAD